jgi:SAM-dependent methyltransferase
MIGELRSMTLRTAGRMVRSVKRTPIRVRDWDRFWRNYNRYRRLESAVHRRALHMVVPHVEDATATTAIEPIYFYQDAWAFGEIVARRPARHIDVGSHHKYVALLSKVVPTTMVDLRPLSLPLDSLKFIEGSILELPFPDQSLESISSLCVVEHIGLGRYGDELDPDGSEKAIAELVRVVAPDGRLYFSVPVGRHHVVAFNEARSFPRDYLLEQLAPLELVEERYIVGDVFQEAYADGPPFSVTGLFELRRP